MPDAAFDLLPVTMQDHDPDAVGRNRRLIKQPLLEPRCITGEVSPSGLGLEPTIIPDAA